MASLFGNSFGTLFSNLFGSVGDADVLLQDLLDPLDNETGIRIIRRMDAGPTANYYVVPRDIQYRGRSKWVETLRLDNNPQKAAKIRTACTIPAQPDAPYGT